MKRQLLIELHRLLSERFDKGEFQTLCFYLGISYADLPGEGLSDKARELVAHCERHGHVSKLIEAGAEQRPGIPWPNPSQEVEQRSKAIRFSHIHQCRAVGNADQPHARHRPYRHRAVGTATRKD
jgi:hypothetical protein